MGCNGLCARYHVRRGKAGYYNDKTIKRCQVCEKFVKWQGGPKDPKGLFCPCCNYRLRTKPRNMKYKEKLVGGVKRYNMEDQPRPIYRLEPMKPMLPLLCIDETPISVKLADKWHRPCAKCGVLIRKGEGHKRDTVPGGPKEWVHDNCIYQKELEKPNGMLPPMPAMRNDLRTSETVC